MTSGIAELQYSYMSLVWGRSQDIRAGRVSRQLPVRFILSGASERQTKQVGGTSWYGEI
jgi:hypothetical protein